MAQTRLAFDIDEELKVKLQIIALQEKKSMKQIVTELIQEFVAEKM